MMILRSLWACRRGSAGAEMVLITPVLAGLLFVGMDIGLAFSQKLRLEQAAQRGVELALAPGTVGTGNFSHVSTDVVAAYGKPVQSIRVDNWLECNGVRQNNWNSFCPAGQTFARYVSVRVQDDYEPSYDFGGVLPGRFRLTGDAAARLQ